VKAHGVVYLLPSAEFAIQLFHLQGTNRDLVELVGVGAVGAFDGAVEFGGAGRKHEQAQAAPLTSRFELGGELASAIDLQCTNREGHAVQQGLQKLRGGLGGGARVGLNHVPARNHVAGGELLDDHAGQGTHVQGIDLDQIAGPGNRVLLGFADGIGTCPQNAATAGNAAAGCFDQLALPPQLAEDAAHHRSRDRQLLLADQDGKLVLAPAGIALA